METAKHYLKLALAQNPENSDVFVNLAAVLKVDQEPFIGLDNRMRQLIDDHTVDLNRLRQALVKPLSISDARDVLFAGRKLNIVDLILATGETVSHLNYLQHREETILSYRSDGKANYRIRS